MIKERERRRVCMAWHKPNEKKIKEKNEGR